MLAAFAAFILSMSHADVASAFGNGGPVTGIAGKCLTNKDGVTANGNKIQIQDCDSTTKQVWQWQGDMAMRVQGYCLDVQTSGTAPGTIVQLWTCNGSGAQRWYKQSDGTLKNQNSNLCLETIGGASANGTGVQISTCSASAAGQQWSISSNAIAELPLFNGAAHNPLPSGPFHTATPTVTLDYSLMPQWGQYMEQVAKPFMEDWYPALVDHYSYPEHGAMPAIKLVVDPAFNGGAVAQWGSRTIRFNPGEFGYASKQAGFEGILIHELTHLLQYNEARSSSGLPAWVIEGWADDARHNVFGTQRPTLAADALYVGGYFPTTTVLERAQQQSGETFMKALSQAGWNGTYTYDLFKQNSGSTPAEHWNALTNDTVSEVGNLVNAVSNKCVELPNGSADNGGILEIDACATTNYDVQNWAFKAPQNTSAGVIVGVHAFRCISVDGNGTAAGTAVSYRTCNSNANPGQKWEFVGGTLRNPNSGKCLQPEGAAQANNTQLEIETCNGSLIQQWKLPPIVREAAASVTSKVLYPGTFPDGQAGIGTTDAQGNGYNRILTAPANNTYIKPTLSPDGGSVAYYQAPNGQQNVTLRAANADGTNSRQLAISNYFITTSSPQPLWSPDNSKVLVAVTPTGQTATNEQWIWLWVNADGSGQQVVSSQVTGGTPFAVTADKIYYTNDGAIDQQLCFVDSQDGTGETCFGQATDPKTAALSDDGARAASLATGTTTSVQVTNLNTATTSTISLPSLGGGLSNIDNLTWVPHTSKIAFRATVSGRPAWYTVDATNTTQIGKLNINANPITWYANVAPKLKAGAFTALTPFRITDTRAGSGQLNANKTLTPGATLDVQVAGLGGVPAEGVSAVVLNITEATSTSSGFLTVYPAGTTRPTASTVNNTAGKIVNNQTTVGLGADGKVSVYNFTGNTDVIVDVAGYYSEDGGSFTPTTPKRIIDTRSGGGQPIGANGTRNVQVTGVQGIPSSAVSVVADVTEVNATSTGFLTLYPSGSSVPTASSMNYYANETLTKEVNVKLDTYGALTVRNGSSGTAHVIIDIVGYYTADMSGLTYTPVGPTRIADTRAGSGKPYAGQPLGNTSTKLFAIDSSVMPGNAAAVVNNTTLATATASTFLTVFAADIASVPAATSVTYVSPIAFNQSTVALSSGPSGGFKLYNHVGTTNVVLDALGYYY